MLEICREAERVFQEPEIDKVERLVRDVVSALSARKLKQDSASSSKLNDYFINLLCEAARWPDRRAQIVAVRALEAGRISRTDITDKYIPEAARRMGEWWSEDKMSFVDVTIGSARLQSMLRDLGPEWRGDMQVRNDARNALMIVPSGCHHTLGAMVAMGQLRRLGLSVCLALGEEVAAIGSIIQARRFDMIMISACDGTNVDALRAYVNCIRGAVVPPVPVVIGGSMLSQHMDICRLTGADLGTCDATEAVSLCSADRNSGSNRLKARNG